MNHQAATALTKLSLLAKLGGRRLGPVAVDEVAPRLCELSSGDPADRVADILGPEVLPARELADVNDEQTHRRHRSRLPVRIPGELGRAYYAGDNLATTDSPRDSGTCGSFWSNNDDQLDW